MKHLMPHEKIANKIFFIRGHRVILDSDLANLYGVTTGNFNKAVKRNIDRFPDDFMFQLTKQEFQNLMFQIGISSSKWGGRRKSPCVFTEQGVAMLSSVLNSKRAIKVNIQIMRTFTKLREMISTHEELAHKFAELERRVESHDQHIHSLFEAIRQLMSPSEPKRRRIGFHRN